MPDKKKEIIDSERYRLLSQIENWLEMPIIILGIIWLILLAIEFIRGLTPALNIFILFIWGIFIAEFLLRFVLAPKKFDFLKKNIITLLSLIVPALRVFRVFHALRILRLTRAARGIRLFRVLSSLNRGLKSLRKTFRRKGFGYILVFTILLTIVGAAAMYNFESETKGFNSYGDSLWWTAMIMTTSGSADWPVTPEGRVLAFLLALYAFAVFGYVTATIASYFIEREADNEESEVAGQKHIRELVKEIKELKEEIKNKNA
jgi:voltage-gated potassium channel